MVIKPPTTKKSLQQSSFATQSRSPEQMAEEVEPHQAVPSQSKWRLTAEQLYAWSFRIVVLLIVSSILFVAAIYYGLINP